MQEKEKKTITALKVTHCVRQELSLETKMAFKSVYFLQF